MAPTAPDLCGAAAQVMERVADLADCTLVAADGSSYKMSKAVTAMHSLVLGCASEDLPHMLISHLPTS